MAEYIAMPDGGLLRVFSAGAALLTEAEWLAARTRRCACGKPTLGSGQTCGDGACIAELSTVTQEGHPDDPSAPVVTPGGYYRA